MEIQKACDDATEAKKKYLETPISKNDTSLDLISQLTESDDKGSSKATLADLQSEADLLKTIQKEMSDNGNISVSSMQSIIKQYPEAKKALSEYMAGLIDEQELFAQLENVYNDDKSQYINAVLEKVQADEEFFSSLKTGYPEVLAEIYGNNKENFIRHIIAGNETNKDFIDTFKDLNQNLKELQKTKIEH